MRWALGIFKWSAYLAALFTLASIPFSAVFLLRQIAQGSGTRHGYVFAYIIVFYLPMTARLIKWDYDDPNTFRKREVRDRIIVGGIGVFITAFIHCTSSSFDQFSSQTGFLIVILTIICVSMEKGLHDRARGQ
jgi:hypothetical protein